MTKMCLTSDASGLGFAAGVVGSLVVVVVVAGVSAVLAAGAALTTSDDGALAGDETGGLNGALRLTGAAGAAASARAVWTRRATAAMIAGDGPELDAEARMTEVAKTDTTANAASCARVTRPSRRRGAARPAAAPRSAPARSPRAAAPRPCARGRRAAGGRGSPSRSRARRGRTALRRTARSGGRGGRAAPPRSRDHDRVGQLLLLLDVALAALGLDLLDDFRAVGLLLRRGVLADDRVLGRDLRGLVVTADRAADRDDHRLREALLELLERALRRRARGELAGVQDVGPARARLELEILRIDDADVWRALRAGRALGLRHVRRRGGRGERLQPHDVARPEREVARDGRRGVARRRARASRCRRRAQRRDQVLVRLRVVPAGQHAERGRSREQRQDQGRHARVRSAPRGRRHRRRLGVRLPGHRGEVPGHRVAGVAAAGTAFDAEALAVVERRAALAAGC